MIQGRFLLNKVWCSSCLFQWTVINRDSSSYFPPNIGIRQKCFVPKFFGLFKKFLACSKKFWLYLLTDLSKSDKHTVRNKALWLILKMNHKIGHHRQSWYFWNQHDKEISKMLKFLKLYDGLLFLPHWLFFSIFY